MEQSEWSGYSLQVLALPAALRPVCGLYATIPARTIATT
jgi:hypothetical protein